MRFGLEKMLAKYDDMSKGGPAGYLPKPYVPTNSSRVWSAFLRYTVNKSIPTRREFIFGSTFEDMMAAIKRMAGPAYAPGGSPRTSVADAYMADIVGRLYKQTACPTGVYTVRCTEGTVRGQADDSRVAALAYNFRLGQRSTAQKFGDFFEMRRSAIVQAHGCSYEEKYGSMPKVGTALVRGAREAQGTCSRYSEGSGIEKYMIASVDKQMKFRAVPYGVYDVMCADGTVSGMAENKRVVSMSAKFRAGQVSDLAKTQGRYDAMNYARVNYTHGCTYEEDLFHKYPAVALAMRSPSVRYN